jgi:hypothetical protein
MFNPRLTVHAEGEVVPGVARLTKLPPAQPGVARFEVACSCGEVTIVHVPVAEALACGEGSYQCGCGWRHRFALTPELRGGNPR